jgi:phosphogluconate dehydratase
MSGASGKVLAAIHLTPEALADGPIAKIRDGDVITIDAGKGILAMADNDEVASRVANAAVENLQTGMGRELFAAFRERATGAEQGASLFGGDKV